jgi:hypothetical protein
MASNGPHGFQSRSHPVVIRVGMIRAESMFLRSRILHYSSSRYAKRKAENGKLNQFSSVLPRELLPDSSTRACSFWSFLGVSQAFSMHVDAETSDSAVFLQSFPLPLRSTSRPRRNFL